MTTTINTISIQDAADQLGLPEVQFRKLLTGIVKNPSTIKKISLDKFKLIGESLRSRAESEQTELVEQPEQLEADTKLQVNDDIEQSSELSPQSSELPESSELQSQSSELATTTAEESSELDTERTRVQLNINLNLQNQVLDLNKITSALAVVAGEEVVKNFEEIYTHTVNTGVDRVISKVAQETYRTIQELRQVDNADFLEGKGRGITAIDSQQAIDQVISLL